MIMNIIFFRKLLTDHKDPDQTKMSLQRRFTSNAIIDQIEMDDKMVYVLNMLYF